MAHDSNSEIPKKKFKKQKLNNKLESCKISNQRDKKETKSKKYHRFY